MARSDGDSVVDAQQFPDVVDNLRQIALNRCWFNRVKRIIVGRIEKNKAGKVWDKNGVVGKVVTVTVLVAISIPPVIVKMCVNLNEKALSVVEFYISMLEKLALMLVVAGIVVASVKFILYRKNRSKNTGINGREGKHDNEGGDGLPSSSNVMSVDRTEGQSNSTEIGGACNWISPNKLAWAEFFTYILFAAGLVVAMVADVWITWGLSVGLYKYAVVAGELSGFFVILGQLVGTMYVPLRRIAYVDLVCVSKNLQSAGWALVPAPFVLVVMQVLIQMMGKEENRMRELSALFLALLSWVVNFIKQRRQWFSDYTTRREGVEEKLDALVPKKYDEFKCSYSIDGDEVKSLCNLIRVGVSERCSGLPLVPTEILSLYVAVRIFRWPGVREVILKEWKLNKVPSVSMEEHSSSNKEVPSEPSGDAPSSQDMDGQPEVAGNGGRIAKVDADACGQSLGDGPQNLSKDDARSQSVLTEKSQSAYEAWRIMGELVNAPYYMRKCTRENLEDLMNSEFIMGGSAAWKSYLAADALVRETIFSSGLVVR